MRQYREQVGNSGPAGTSQVRVPNMDDGIGQALRYTGNQIERAGNTVQAQRLAEQEHARREAAQKEVQHARVEALRLESEYDGYLDRLVQDAPEDGSGLDERINADLQKQRESFLGGYKTPEGQQAATEIQERLRLRLLGEAGKVRAQRQADVSTRRASEALTSAEKIVFRDAGRYDETIGNMADVVQGLAGLDQNQKAELIVRQGRAMAFAAGRGAVERDPAGTLRDLRAEKPKATWVSHLDLDDQERLASAAQSELNRREAEARARQAEAREILRADVEDAFAKKSDGGPAMLPSRAAFVTAYGGAEGARRYQDAAKRWKAFDIAAEAVFLPPEEAAAKLSAMRPTQQAGAAGSLEAYEMGVKLYQQQRKVLEDDPVGTLLRQDPKIAAAREQLRQQPGDPAATDGYFRALTARQQALGIEKPALLPAAARDQVAQAFEFNPEKPTARVEAIAQLRAGYGKWFGQVIAEVAPKLDGHARVLVNMTPAQASRLDAALAQKPDLEKIVPGTAKSDISAMLDSELADFAETLAEDVDAESRLGETLEAADLLAKSMVARGSQPADAARAAAAAVVNDQFTYRGTMRIPKNLDADTIENAAETKRIEVARAGGFRVQPGSLADATIGEADMRSLIERRGYWITTKDGAGRATGLALRIPHRSGLGDVLRADGSRVAFTWEELANAGAAAAEASVARDRAGAAERNRIRFGIP